MKVCFVGSSGHFNYPVDGIKQRPDIHVAGLAPGSKDEAVDRLAAALSGLGREGRRYADWRVMVDAENPDIAVVNSHFRDHARIGMELLARGIHVYMEKPVATTQEDLEALKTAHAKGTAKLGAMFALRYAPWFQAAKRAMPRIGQPRLASGQKSYRFGTRPEFFKDRSIYGGTIPWVGSHAFDWTRWLVGEEYVWVAATQSTVGNRNHGTMEVSASCLFGMTKGVSAAFTIDLLRPQGAPSHDDDRLRIAGTEGIVEVRDHKAYFLGEGGLEELELEPGMNPFLDFAADVEGKGPCLVSAKDAFLSTEACLKARLAADTSEIVSF